jgi:3-mercaptopyruvate sulfurtransferase SseA
MSQDGYKEVLVLKGGWREWFRAQYPVDERK